MKARELSKNIMIPANVSTTDQRLSNPFFRSSPVQTFPTFMQMNTQQQQQQQHYPHFPFASLNQSQIALSQRVSLPSYLVPSSNGVMYSPIPQPITEAKSYPYSLPQQQQKQMMENLIHQQHQQPVRMWSRKNPSHGHTLSTSSWSPNLKRDR